MTTEIKTDNETLSALTKQVDFPDNLAHNALVECTLTEGSLLQEYREVMEAAGNIYVIRFLIGLAEKGCITFDPNIIGRSNRSAFVERKWPDAKIVIEAITSVDKERCKAEKRDWAYSKSDS